MRDDPTPFMKIYGKLFIYCFSIEHLNFIIIHNNIWKIWFNIHLHPYDSSLGNDHLTFTRVVSSQCFLQFWLYLYICVLEYKLWLLHVIICINHIFGVLTPKNGLLLFVFSDLGWEVVQRIFVIDGRYFSSIYERKCGSRTILQRHILEEYKHFDRFYCDHERKIYRVMVHNSKQFEQNQQNYLSTQITEHKQEQSIFGG
jgi:hypothetical protein